MNGFNSISNPHITPNGRGGLGVGNLSARSQLEVTCNNAGYLSAYNTTVQQSERLGLLLSNYAPASNQTLYSYQASAPLVFRGSTFTSSKSQPTWGRIYLQPINTINGLYFDLSYALGTTFTTVLKLTADTYFGYYGAVIVPATLYSSGNFAVAVNQQALFGVSAPGAVSTYKSTNGSGSTITGLVLFGASATNTVGTQALAYDTTDYQIKFNAANGTRHITRAIIGITNLGNGAGSESADLIIGTQTAGNAAAERIRITGAGLLGVGVSPTKAYVEIAAGGSTVAPLCLSSGTMNTTAQGGALEFNGAHYETNTARIRYAKLGTIFDAFDDVSNSSTTETDLHSYTTAADTLRTSGEKLQADYGGILLNSATATRQIKMYFGGSLMFDSGALTITTTSSFILTTTIIRVSSSIVRCMTTLALMGNTTPVYTEVREITGLTLGSTNILKITGQSAGTGAATGDITLKMCTGRWAGAAY